MLSHAASQSIEGEGRRRAGDYWHAIMHRREPDYGNSKYWFRRVGRHPVQAELAIVAGQVLQEPVAGRAAEWSSRLIQNGAWNPFAFVDLCEAAAVDEASELGVAARRLQSIEMRLLLLQTWQDARQPG